MGVEDSPKILEILENKAYNILESLKDEKVAGPDKIKNQIWE